MNAFAGYEYNPSTGTYTRNPNFRPPAAGTDPSAFNTTTGAPPPRPPKEPTSPITQAYHPSGPYSPQIQKETQYDIPAASSTSTTGTAELESEPRQSLDSLTAQTLHAIQTAAAQTQQRNVRVLSLDGGGIRGYSTLIILQELMHQVYVYTHGGKGPKSPADLPRPCDYFDLIGGNGTGGLIALMLGRMRMNVETCKETYVNLTRFVFITDKTLLGMPYGKTLFKASRLEEAIKYCVESATRYDHLPIIPGSPPPTDTGEPQWKPLHRRSDSWRRSSSRRESTSSSASRSSRTSRPTMRGDINAPLLDTRENATRTLVTAMLAGSRKGAQPVMLRSYPSSAESVPSYKTTIWQAGRATCATAQAFKPITIDQTTFLDEGSGQYNPAFQIIEEVRENEFPDAHVAAFVSVGTGKRPKSAYGTESRREWWEGVVFEDFSEAKRRLMRRVDDCERVHRELVDGIDGGRPRLAKAGIAAEDYYRFNVEVGVGEFGMNEWNRLAEVATGTRRYLAQRETARFVKECAIKLVESVRQKPPNPAVAALQQTAAPQSSQIRQRVTSSPPLPSQTQPPMVPPMNPNRPRAPSLQQQYQQQQKPLYADMEEKQVVVGPVPARKPSPYSTPPVNQTPYAPPPHPHPAYQPPPPPGPPNPYIDNRPQRQSPTQTQLPFRPPPPQSSTHGQPNQPPYPQTSPFPQPQVGGRIIQPQPFPSIPQLAQNPGKEGKVVLPPRDEDADTPNPEIRVTSPTTVAGDSDEEEEQSGGRRRRRRRLRSASKGPMEGIDE